METIKTFDFVELLNRPGCRHWRTSEYINHVMKRCSIDGIECRGIGSYGGGRRLAKLTDAVFMLEMKLIRERHCGNH